jgi:Na+/citrate or Na+/malate symporter
MIIAWIVFVIGSICTFVWLSSNLFDSKEEIKQRKSFLNFWIWLIITSCSAQYIWG